MQSIGVAGIPHGSRVKPGMTSLCGAYGAGEMTWPRIGSPRATGFPSAT